MRAVRLGLALAALALAAAAVVLGFRWPWLAVLLGVAAAAAGVAARMTEVGRHGGRAGAHARPGLLDEARASAAQAAQDRAGQQAVRAVIDPRQPHPEPPAEAPASWPAYWPAYRPVPPPWTVSAPARHRAADGAAGEPDPAPFSLRGCPVLAPGKIPARGRPAAVTEQQEVPRAG